MKMKQLFLGLLFLSSFAGVAQKSSKEVLFTINDKPYYTDEFMRVYKKNLDLVKDESQKDLDQYLDLFIGYKLKVNRAHNLGLQDSPQYKNELKSYRNQLSKNYFNDTKVTQELIEEGYKRSLKEVKASHILVMVDETAAPEDTLKAYKKIMDIRQRALKGEDFGVLAEQMSEDPSAKDNKGNLGYFSAFRMVYPFETAAYTTPAGKISMPVRTRFGYHLIKVNDVRDNRGEVTVAHIMIFHPKPEEADQERAKNSIQDIYKKIKNGEKFEELAQQFSDDKMSGNKGGELNRFGAGQISSEEFEDISFSLVNPNDVSEPFQTQFGWHIVKLIEKHKMKSLEEMRADLEDKISKDDRSKKIATTLNDKLRKKYNPKKDAKQFAVVSKLITMDYYDGNWKSPENKELYKATLLTVNNKKIDGNSFFEYVEKQQGYGGKIKPLAKLVNKLFEDFTNEKLNEYYNDNLENEFPEFSNIMDEYRDGLLLFDLMEKEIWERSKTDTIGLQKFYDVNKMRYLWKNRVDAIVVSTKNAELAKKAQKMLKKNETVDVIKEKLNTNGAANIMANKGIYEEGNPVMPKSFQFKEGVSDLIKEGDFYYVIKVAKVLPESVKTMEECKGKLVNDYQQFLEQGWVDELKREFTISVDKNVFNKIKQELK